MSDWQDYPVENPATRPLDGRLKVLRQLASPQLGNARDILALLPESHGTGIRYPVVYMHDGQNLFDPVTSFARQWDAGSAMRILALEGIEAILVGLPNAGPRRIDEYSPFADGRLGGGSGDDYLDFVSDTVKPLVDASFDTMPGRAHTYTAGSSMGGLISLWAFFRHNEVFGGAAAFSPALWFARRAIFGRIEAMPSPPGRIYLDAGTAEGPMLLAHVARLRAILIEKGYRTGRDLRFVIERKGRHDEESWGRRLPGALRFLLSAVVPATPSPTP
jgi:predicted alpha/beta superfamily hydrolase